MARNKTFADKSARRVADVAGSVQKLLISDYGDHKTSEVLSALVQVQLVSIVGAGDIDTVAELDHALQRLHDSIDLHALHFKQKMAQGFDSSGR